MDYGRLLLFKFSHISIFKIDIKLITSVLIVELLWFNFNNNKKI
ncbi:hypothetical protein NC99_00550 [Sunxiuqinia dokdonensis]|uniref:Uncharacterized protein n=1 Tax=Sunxiuqinia dokdonensis TaxID=1409788 RepID=A0A0L8VF70_9BACT|nr:hypothetical protein NC99_00550 [Sunxiuqinia dokdonensis]